MKITFKYDKRYLNSTNTVKEFNEEITNYEGEQGEAICMSLKVATIKVLEAVRHYVVMQSWEGEKYDAHAVVYNLLQPLVSETGFKKIE